MMAAVSHERCPKAHLRSMALSPHHSLMHRVRIVKRFTERESEEQVQMLGDLLPTGPRLLPAEERTP
jgi:hypothetical protein